MNAKEIDTNSNLNMKTGDSERRGSNLSIGGLLKLAKQSCDTEVVETHRESLRGSGSSRCEARRAISKREVQQIIDSKVQWEKLKQQIRDRKATTGMMLKQELQGFLAERLNDIPMPVTNDNIGKKYSKFAPNFQQLVIRRLSTLQSEAAVSSIKPLVIPLMMTEHCGEDNKDDQTKDRSHLLRVFDEALHITNENGGDQSMECDQTRPMKQVMPRMA